ncbi:DUF6588 family protein [Flammeovirgaceae bacterium SG7u.111]|nr:DUF6588 family protein [Flammeovirgaceae bacterium SG7u.132]WPO38009.1 DUF6588 family protein [Flammeovirgaceae bacterium SG7u.111]
MKKVLLIVLVFLSAEGSAQDEVKGYLSLGVKKAEQLTSLYIQPLSEGLMYGLTGGWYNSAEVNKKWELDFSIIANGSFVPKDKLSTEIDISRFENLEVKGGGNKVTIPTIFGSTDATVTFIATVDDDKYEFDAPTGIGLLSANLLPNAFLQASLGLPANTELSFRVFPKQNLDDASVGEFGFGLKHELSKSIKSLNELPISISAFAAYTRLDADYTFQVNGLITGESQFVDVNIKTFQLELLVSTKNPTWNLYGGVGYVTGGANYSLKGTYVIETQNETLTFVDPFNVHSDISGMRACFGGKVSLGRFGINVDYTFQGYNNAALGLNYTLLKGKAEVE